MQCSATSRFLVFLLRKRTGETVKTHFFFPAGKRMVFGIQRKRGSVWVEWSQIGIRRPGFTPPSRSSPVYGRLPRRNRDKRWSYPTFFRPCVGGCRNVVPLPGIPSVAGVGPFFLPIHFSLLPLPLICVVRRTDTTPPFLSFLSLFGTRPSSTGGTGPFPFAIPRTFPCKCRGDLV